MISISTIIERWLADSLTRDTYLLHCECKVTYGLIFGCRFHSVPQNKTARAERAERAERAGRAEGTVLLQSVTFGYAPRRQKGDTCYIHSMCVSLTELKAVMCQVQIQMADRLSVVVDYESVMH